MSVSVKIPFVLIATDTRNAAGKDYERHVELAAPVNTHYAFRQAAEDFIRYHSNLKAKRSEPYEIRVEICQLVVEAGLLSRKEAGSVYVPLPLEARTAAEFEAEMGGILADIPPEFHQFVADIAGDEPEDDDQHLNRARVLVQALIDPIGNYGISVIAKSPVRGKKPKPTPKTKAKK